MTNPIYSKTNPFYASITERYSLCKPGSNKNTQHIVLNIKDSGLTYQTGDSIAVFPKNDPVLVQHTLQMIHATGNESVLDRDGKVMWNLREFLTTQANVHDITRKLLTEVALRQRDPSKRIDLERLQEEGNREAFKNFLAENYIYELLEQNPEVEFDPQDLCNLLAPLLPRFYSIASSQSMVGDEIHLTVVLTKYHLNGRQRLGVCTHFLCNLAALEEPVIPIYMHPHRGFTLPHDHHTPIIMIGPGTGVAPFRAFMQERKMKSARGRNWLFFGEWNRETDFFYEDFWHDLKREGMLRLETAFSRDQEHKIYVQHRMLEHGEELFRWLLDGAYLFVCGDAEFMAKDVETALLQIIQVHGKLDEKGAKQFLKQLRTEKRYLRDVY